MEQPLRTFNIITNGKNHLEKVQVVPARDGIMIPKFHVRRVLQDNIAPWIFVSCNVRNHSVSCNVPSLSVSYKVTNLSVSWMYQTFLSLATYQTFLCLATYQTFLCLATYRPVSQAQDAIMQLSQHAQRRAATHPTWPAKSTSFPILAVSEAEYDFHASSTVSKI